ncbi:unnamed protein product [Rotaria sp. Silwood1]|nr:unnamed protein product [Rotaria sp. Silwood1]
MTTVEQLKKVGHVVMISPPFFGHIIPLLDLGKRLSVHHHVTYIVSASKLDGIKQRGFLVDNENNPTNDSTRSEIEFIGIFDNNDSDYEVKTIARVKQWLDRQWKLANESPSVIYVAFGSVACMMSDQLIQIAHALAPYPIVWLLKAKCHNDLPSSFADNEKYLLLDWAP